MNGSGKDGFFNPFAGLKNQIQNAEETPPRPEAASAKKAGPQKNAGGAGSKKPEPKAMPHAPKQQDAEDAALFLSAMQSTPRYVKSYSTQTPSAPDTEPDMAELLAEAERKRPKKSAPKGDGGEASPAPGPASRKPPAGKAIPDLDISSLDLSPEEADSFAKAMQDVRPVDGKGRDLAPAIKPPAPRQELEVDYMAEIMQGKFEFALEYTEEFFEGHVMGLDPLVIAKLRGGQYSPESYIDLHGQNAEQAYASLLEFIRHSYNQGLRSLIVVTGRGKNSPGGFSILRQHMQDWLTKDPLKRVVLAFCTAQPKDGGGGALYIMLRKHKKSSGKIRWERHPSEEGPLL